LITVHFKTPKQREREREREREGERGVALVCEGGHGA